MAMSPQCKRLRAMLKAVGIKPIGGCRTLVYTVKDPGDSRRWREYGPAQAIIAEHDRTALRLNPAWRPTKFYQLPQSSYWIVEV